jgi:hypothetical protein
MEAYYQNLESVRRLQQLEDQVYRYSRKKGFKMPRLSGTQNPIEVQAEMVGVEL